MGTNFFKKAKNAIATAEKIITAGEKVYEAGKAVKNFVEDVKKKDGSKKIPEKTSEKK